MEKEKKIWLGRGSQPTEVQPNTCISAQQSSRAKTAQQESPSLCGHHEAPKPLHVQALSGDRPKDSVTLKAEMGLAELAAAIFQLTHILCNWTACLCF